MNSNEQKKNAEGLKVGTSTLAGVVIGGVGAVAAQPLYAAEVEGETLSVLEESATEETEEVAATVDPTKVEVEFMANGQTYNVEDVNQDGKIKIGINVTTNVAAVDNETETQEQPQELAATETEEQLPEQDVVIEEVYTSADVMIEGVAYHFRDINGDGIADLAATDLNNNGVIDREEIFDIREGEVQISDLASYQQNYEEDMAYNNEEVMADYINDANVNEYMA